MIKMYKATSVEALNFLTDYLNPLDEFENKKEMASSLQGLLLSVPDRCFFSIIVDDNKNSIEGFLLAFLDRGNIVKILQMFISSDEIKKNFDMLMVRLLVWCEERQVAEIRIDDRRNSIVPFSKWVLKDFSRIYAIDVNSSIDEVLTNVGDKNESDRIRRVVDTDTAAAVDNEHTAEKR